MSITFVGHSIPVYISSGTTVTNTYPAGIQVGDLIIAHYFHRSTLSDTGGFTLTPEEDNGTLGQKTGLGYKIATGNESGNISITQSSSDRAGLAISVWRFSGTPTVAFTQGQTQDLSPVDPPMVFPEHTQAGNFLVALSFSVVYFRTAASGVDKLPIAPTASADPLYTNLNTTITSDENRLGLAGAIMTDRSTAVAEFDSEATVDGRPNDSGVMVVFLDSGGVVDSTPPVLSGGTANNDGTGSVTTDEANGTLRSVITTSATPPTKVAIKAETGFDYFEKHTVAATGAYNVAATGLAHGTTYHWHHLHTDSSDNDSNIVTVSFTTPTVGITPVGGSAVPTYVESDTTHSIAYPAGIQAGDLIIVGYFRRSALTSTDGFTVRHEQVSGDTTGQVTGIATKVATGTESGSITFTQASAGRMGLFVTVKRFDGVITYGVGADNMGNAYAGSAPIVVPPITHPDEYLAIAVCSTPWLKDGLSTSQQLTPRPDATADPAWTNIAGDVGDPVNRLGVSEAIFNNRSTEVAAFAFPFGSTTKAFDAALVYTFRNIPSGDTTAPILTLPTATNTGAGTVTTNEGNGLLHSVVTTSVTPPSDSDIISKTGVVYGDDQNVTAVGLYNVLATGLANSTTYYWHHLHVDAAGNHSDVVTVSFTTPAALVTTVVDLDDWDSAIGTGTVTDATTNTPTITIDPFDNSNVSGWINVRLRVYGLLNKTGIFKLDYTNWRRANHYPAPSDYGICWQYASVYEADPGNGKPPPIIKFANSSVSSLLATVSHSAAFTEDVVYVFAKAPWRYIDTVRAIAFTAPKAQVFELPSSVAATTLPTHVHSTITVTGETDNNAPNNTPLNLYCIGLEDTTVQPDFGKEKLNLVLMGGAHASEDQGDMQAWAFIYFFTDSNDPEAVWLRKHVKIYFYNTNPSGRYYGSERWTEEATDEDPNRAWDDSGSEQVNSIKAALALDLTRVDMLMDCHGDFRLNGDGYSQEFGGFYDGSRPKDVAYRNALNSIVPGGYAAIGTTPTNGTAEQYGVVMLSAQVSITSENPYAADGYPDMDAMYDRTAKYHAQAIHQLVTNGDIVLSGGEEEVTPAPVSLNTMITQPTISDVPVAEEVVSAASIVLQTAVSPVAIWVEEETVYPASIVLGVSINQPAITDESTTSYTDINFYYCHYLLGNSSL